MAMAVIDKLVNLGMPWLQAIEIDGGAPTVAILQGSGMSEMLATAVVATDGVVDNAANRVTHLPKLMSGGLSGNLAIEVFDHLADG